ncbi:MAG: urease accessory protein UreD [Methylophilaceae bacterium]
MDDVTFSNTLDYSTAKPSSAWQATLNLAFERDAGRTFLAKKNHVGPLVVQKSLHPEGERVCHAILVHPPGGVAGGDALTLNVQIGENAHALLTSPGAGKWYKANGQFASQHLAFCLEKNACLEWLPQENILFNGSQVEFSADIALTANAKYAGWEILCFGRQAQAEQWLMGNFHQRLSIRRNDKLIWQECARLSPDLMTLKSLSCLGENVVSASFVIAAGEVPADLMVACREVKPSLALDEQAKYAATAMPAIFSARYVGQSAQCARHYFESLWQILRPWYAKREVTRPRIWNT